MFPLTFAVLAILTGVLIAVRVRWHHLSPKTHTTLIACACAALIVYVFKLATDWGTSSDHLNAAFYWFAIAGYEFFLLLFTLLRPRWLTTIIATVLIFPVVCASSFLPLTDLFNKAPHTIVSIGPNLISDRYPWGTENTGGSGFDIAIYSHPSWTKVIRRRRQGARYYNSQCDAAQVTAILQPDGKHILMSCPAAPGQQPDAARNLVVKLY